MKNSVNFQRGAIGIWGLLILLLGLLCMALVVDSARLWMQQRQLQRVADMAALDAAQNLNCGTALSNVQTAAQAAAERNGYVGNLSAAPNEVQIGSLTSSSGIRQFTASGEHEAVRVYATRQVPSSLVVGGLIGGQITLHAQAVARSRASLVSFSTGTYGLALDTADSALANRLFSQVLGGNINLSLLSYQGIANTQISLLNLVKASATAGGVNGLLNTEMPLIQTLTLLQNAAAQQGADPTTISALQTLINNTTNSKTISLSDLLEVSTIDPNRAADIGINLYSLLNATAIVANGSNALSVPGLQGSILGLNVSSVVQVIHPPKLQIGVAGKNGSTYCTMTQTAAVQARVLLTGNIPLDLPVASLNLALNLQVAQGSAGLISVENHGASSEIQIAATPGIAALTITNQANTGPATLKLLLGIFSLPISANVPIQPPSETTLTFDVDHPIDNNLPQTQSVSSSLGGSLGNVLASPSAISVGGYNAILTPLLSSIVSPVLGLVGSALDPLLKMLGIQVGGISVTVDGLQDHDLSPLVI